MLRGLAVLLALSVIMAATLLVGVLLWVHHCAAETATRAQAVHGGDRVEALMAFAASEEHPLQARNRAVWALGRLGDARARPLLDALYTGAECDHARFVCQYEIEKARARLE